MHLDELEALRACVNQLQSESDEKAEDGALHRQLLDRERQVHELKAKVATLDRYDQIISAVILILICFIHVACAKIVTMVACIGRWCDWTNTWCG